MSSRGLPLCVPLSKFDASIPLLSLIFLMNSWSCFKELRNYGYGHNVWNRL